MNIPPLGWFCLGAVLLSIFCALIYLFYRAGIRRGIRNTIPIQREIDKKYDQAIQEKTTKLNQLNELLFQTEKDYRELIQKHQESTTTLQEQIHSLQLNKLALSESFNSIQSQTETKILYGSKEHKSYLFKELEKEFTAKKLTLSQECTIIEKEKEKVQEQLQELQNSRAAAIAALKREEEIKQESNFYKVQLQETDIEDIKLLRSIERYLVNKDALYKLIWSTYYQKPYKELIGRLTTGKVCGIYRITNLLDSRSYIGQSVDITNRWGEHIKSSLGIGSIAHQKVHNAIAEKGIENFTFEIIEECDKSELSAKEKLWIKTYQSDSYGYNATSGG